MSKTEPKKFTLTDDERAELSFYVRETSVKQMEYEFWAHKSGNLEREVAKRLAIDPEKSNVDWSQAINLGEITVTPKEEPKADDPQKV